MKTLIKFISSLLLFINVFGHLYAQNTVELDSKDNTKALGSISKYTYNQASIVDDELERMGFKIPTNVPRTQWVNFPTVTKIEWAYLSAEKAAPGSGEKVLALLSKSLAQQYQSANTDPLLSRLINTPTSRRINFAQIVNLPAISPINSDLKKVIVKIAKYTDDDALGGINGILTKHFGFTENEAFDIQRNTRNVNEALQKGITDCKGCSNVKVQKANITNVVADLNKSFESSRHEADFIPFMDNSGGVSGNVGGGSSGGGVGSSGGGGGGGSSGNIYSDPISTNVKPQGNGPRGSGVRPPSTSFNSQTHYSNFVRANYSGSKSSRGFSVMKIKKGGFGGVIFGNTVKVDPNLKKLMLDSLQWIPNNDNRFEERGTLVFKYKSGSPKYIRNVLAEDFFAAYDIIFNNRDDASNFAEGTGVGLASLAYGANTTSFNEIYYNDYNEREKRAILLHPSVANLSIGRSLIYTDTAPIILKNITYKIHNKFEINKVKTVLSRFTDWKVTDMPVLISYNNDEIVLNTTKPTSDNKIYFTMIGIGESSFFENNNKIDSTSFNNIASILYKTNYNYKRVNDFIKIFDVLRYVKSEKITKITSQPVYNTFILYPHYIAFDTTGIFFETPLQEGINWRKTINSKIDSIQSTKEMDSIKYNVVKNLLKYAIKDNIKNDILWHQINDYYYAQQNVEEICSLFTNRPSNSNFSDRINRYSMIDSLYSLINNDPRLISLKNKSKNLLDSLEIINSILDDRETVLNSYCPNKLKDYKKFNSELKTLKYGSERYYSVRDSIQGIITSCDGYLSLSDKLKSLRKLESEIYFDTYKFRTSVYRHEIELFRLLTNEKKSLNFLIGNVCAEK